MFCKGTNALSILFEELIKALLIVVGYAVGFLAVIFGSLGTVEPGPTERIGDHSYYRSKAQKWWHLTYVDRGTRYLPAEGVALVGWMIIGSVMGISWMLLKLIA